MKMVNIDDTVLVSFQARASFTDLSPVQQPATDLRARLEQNGFKVLSVNLGELGTVTSMETALTLGYGGWANCQVTVQPLVSAFSSVQDVAGIVAGAAEAVGLEADTANANGAVVGYANPGAGQASSQQYERNQTTNDQSRHDSILDDIANSLGVSKTTLEIGAVVGVVVIFAVSFSGRK